MVFTVLSTLAVGFCAFQAGRAYAMGRMSRIIDQRVADSHIQAFEYLEIAMKTERHHTKHYWASIYEREAVKTGHNLFIADDGRIHISPYVGEEAAQRMREAFVFDIEQADAKVHGIIHSSKRSVH